jgi:DNA-binding transcriptional regulator YiaG
MKIGAEKYITVHDVEGLYKAIALHLIRRKRAFVGSEVRFLRRYLDLTQGELGRYIGVTNRSICAYENGHTVMPGPEHALLRLLVAASANPCIDVRRELESIRAMEEAPDPGDLKLERDDHEWRVVA